MSDLEIQQLKALIVATSSYYGHQIPDQVLLLYVEDLADLPFPAVAQAIRDVRRDPRTTRFPLPAVIRARIQPAPTDEGEAQEAVSRLIDSVARFGWTNGAAAKAHMGELAWLVVQREGGWQNVCANLNQDNLGMTRAQWRQLAMSLLSRAKAGTLGQAPSLPAPNAGAKMPALIGDILKQIPQIEETTT
jgi:hypothetical protein